jgi:hypothetical protein
MLAAKFTTDTEFPLAGSTGFLRHTCEEARIIQRNANGTFLIGVINRFQSRHLASGTRTVPAEDLFATVDEAIHGGKPPKLTRYSRPPAPGRRKARRA